MVWRRWRGVVAAVGAAYLLGLVVVVASPWGWELNRLTVDLYVQLRYDWPIAPDWVSPEHYGALLNVVLFVPFGALAVLVTGRPWWWVIPAAALASVAIELAQGRWLARDDSSWDVVANTAGALLGALAITLRGRTR
ncbi:VanZ family protein [Nocardioides astragali]|uniref:VanZ family protein n=1 Tax=Nocardioides astragali TaxID=1776736 RepID=A0ABW2N5Z5_9ACTN|nr:VanZ family protein [Nocardioides astragali]